MKPNGLPPDAVCRDGERHAPLVNAMMEIPNGAVTLKGDLPIPEDATGLVFFAHGSGSSRPDLAGNAPPLVNRPTPPIVGGYDVEVLQLNEDAYALMRCEKKIEIVQRATHLFEESGALEEVARLAAAWFGQHLGVQA